MAFPWEVEVPSLILHQVLLHDDQHPLEVISRAFAKTFPVPKANSKTVLALKPQYRRSRPSLAIISLCNCRPTRSGSR